ncbi:MAG: hypothetical protein AB1352_05635 [Patescibacteria group bacterium]
MKKIVLWVIGFILSPLSFWNDLFVNVPISWTLALPVALLYRPAFPFAFSVVYIATNVVGMWMMDSAVHLKNNGVATWVNTIGCAILLAATAVGLIPLPIVFVAVCVAANSIGAIVYSIAKNQKRVEQCMTLVYTALILSAVFLGWIPIPKP